jgi:tetratricopeptide (TPR) repeat protein
MKIAFLSVLFLAVAVTAFGQAAGPVADISNYGVRIEPDKRLMVVLAALESARSSDAVGGPLLNIPLSAPGTAFREQMAADLSAMPADLRQKISIFVTQYKKHRPAATDIEIVAPFISMSYTLSPVPELADPVITSDLPGSLLDVMDFAPLVREFYRRSGIGAHIDDYAKAYQRSANATLRPSARQMIGDLLDYLHTRPKTTYTEKVKTRTERVKGRPALERTESRERERRFFIVPELLAPNGVVSFLNVRDDYYVVLPPDTNLAGSEARRAFLQYVFDALVLEHAAEISTVRPGIQALLDERRKAMPDVTPDVYLAVSRSLVAAADARQAEYSRSRIATEQARAKIDTLKTAEEKRAVAAELERFKSSLADETAMRLSDEYEKGAVLDFYFASQFKGLEDSGFDIASSMREMILSLDAAKEANRLAEFADARKRAVASREGNKRAAAPTLIAENPVTTGLLQIQKLIEAHDYAKAEAASKSLLANNPNDPRIYYNLGRIASFLAESISDPDDQNKKLVEAKTAYEKVIEIATKQNVDSALVSLTYVALAKIYEFYDNNSYAIQLYDRAIALGNVSGSGYDEAIAGKQRLLKNP